MNTVKVKIIRRGNLGDRVLRVGEVLSMSPSVARAVIGFGWGEVVSGDAGLPKGARAPERGLLTR